MDLRVRGFGWADSLVLAGCVAVLGLDLLTSDHSVRLAPTWVLVATTLMAAVVLMARRLAPVLTLAVALTVCALPALLWGADELAAPVLLLAVGVFACGRYGRPPVAYLGVVFGAAGIPFHESRDPMSRLSETWPWALNVLWIFAVGAWARGRDEAVAASRRETDERVRAAAAEERLRIAHDLHDVLAHHLALMVVQAEAAASVLPAGDTQAHHALDTVARIGRDALSEIRSVLPGVRDGSSTRGLATTGEAGIGGLVGLVGRLEPTGLRVEVQVSGEPGRLPPELDACVFRVVQESLTNTLRHSACRDCLVSVVVGANGVHVAVTERGGSSGTAAEDAVDGTPRGAVPPTVGLGHGIRGMRERIESLGGSVRFGADTGGAWAVRAWMPLPSASVTTSAAVQAPRGAASPTSPPASATADASAPSEPS